jgi:DNA primase
MSVIIRPDQIESWITKHFDYKRRKGGAELLINNPFDGDTKFKFNINTVKGVCHDWRPGHQHHDGPFLRFVQNFKKISFFEAVREVCGQEVDLRSIFKSARAKEIQEDEPEIVPDASMPSSAKSFRDINEDDKIGKIALNYLISRGIHIETACKHNLHYGIDKVYFPYYEYGVQVYWQARTITSKRFEFPSLEVTKYGKEHYLYGFDNAEPGQNLFVCESIIDSITLGDGAVATGGASMGGGDAVKSRHQCKKIRAIGPSTIILSPDRDFEGLSSILKNTELIESICDAEIRFVVPPPPFKDWNEMLQKSDDKLYPRKYAESNTLPVSRTLTFHVNKLFATI